MSRSSKTNHDLLIEVTTLVRGIIKELQEINTQLAKLADKESSAALDMNTLRMGLSSLKDIVENHLKWHTNQTLRLISYAGLASGAISTIVAVLLKLIGV